MIRMALEDYLVTSALVPAIIAIGVAAVSAWATLRANIREKAWLAVYEEKRREIRALLSAMDDFASTVLGGCEVVELDKRPRLDQLTAIAFIVRQRFGPDSEKSADPLPKVIMSLLPAPEMFDGKPTEATAMVEAAKKVLRNTYELDLQELNVRVSNLKTTLALSLRNPDLIRESSELLTWAYGLVHSKERSFAGVDAEWFGEEWSKRISPIKLGFRQDLTKSSWSLGSATRLSWRWRLVRWRRRREEEKAKAETDGDKIAGDQALEDQDVDLIHPPLPPKARPSAGSSHRHEG